MPRFFSNRIWLLSFSALACGGMMSGGANARPRVQVASVAHLPNGKVVKAVTLSNDHGLKIRILSYGGILQSVEIPDRHGKIANVALGFSTLDGYVAHNDDPHFGAILGRYANRLANGTFTLEGKTYHTPINNPPNTLHGGFDSFDRKLWTIVGTGSDQSGAYVKLKLVSPDGDQGFPGNLTTTVTYMLSADDSLSLNFKAKTDAPTVVNLSTHNYWNLNGEGSGTIEPEILQVFSDRYVPTDANSIPLGTLASVDNTPFDFRTPHSIAERLRSRDPQMVAPRGYDKCWVLNVPPSKTLYLAARVSDPRSGRVMEISTNQPGLQVYTSNSIDGRYVGPSGHAYRQGDALAFEPEHYPDSPNHPDFPSTELKPGEVYDYTTVFHFAHD
ncbi:galactose-1-epimerase [Saccharibacter sp. 17.LH.SD]|uniref:aldose epimerase family protein n=1 Tax=Saccharibacter sp. 17.LH.SD TaxID=2689393 RepID=UPI00136CD704|nr:aldose epimerase family protein [Saccharibacter sp. 17.LH.SD]MXV44895.1 galactose-1-epimerase [Saccharibacter sp. 17.LH.SD]